MRQDRLMQWLLRQRGFSPADTHSTVTVRARFSLLAQNPPQTSPHKSFRGLKALLCNDSTHTTAADAWHGKVDSSCFSTSLSAASGPKPQRSHKQCPFITTAAQQSPLVKQLAAVFEPNQVSSLESVSTEPSLGAADATVLVSVSSTAKPQLESVPSIKGLLQTWESLSTQQQTPVLSRSSSVASCSSSCSSSSYHPLRPVLRPVLAAAAPSVATAAGAAVAHAAVTSSGAAVSLGDEVQEQVVAVIAGTAVAVEETAVLGRWDVVSSAAAVAVGIYLVKACL